MMSHSYSVRRTIAVAILLLTGLASDARSEDPSRLSFDYFRNSWNVVGLKDYQEGSRITPDNRLWLADDVEVRFRFGRGESLLSRAQTKLAMDGWLPVMLLAAEDGPVRYDFTLWSTPLPSVKDWKAAFGWPTEGENFLDWIVVEATNRGDEPADAKLAVELARADGAHLAGIDERLQPGQTVKSVLRIPFTMLQQGPSFEDQDADLWLGRTTAYWRELLASGAEIEVPCRKATEALRAAHVCQLIANDHGELQGGEGFYDQFYIRDGGYQIMELEEAGLGDVAAKAVGRYLQQQRPDGRFETQTKQFDANGQALWVLWQYYKITGDSAWLEEAYPAMRKSVDWLITTRKGVPADSPYPGVLPVAPADGEYLWDGKHHIVGYDVWNLRGLLCTADAALALGRTDEAQELQREATDYRQAIDAAMKKSGSPHFPPSWETEGTHWGNTETLWPTELFQRDDPRVEALIDHARNEHGGGFIEGTIQWLGHADAIHPYMSAYTTMASLARGEHQQVVEDFYWYLLHSTAAHAFPEGIYYKRRFAWSNTIPHVTGASNYAVMLRHMLVHERGDELVLLAAVPDWWLDEGQEIRLRRAPSHFGAVDLTVRGTAQGVEVEWNGPTRRRPDRIVLYLPQSRPLVGKLDGVEVVVRSDQTKRWDFPTVVELYEQDAPEVYKAIPGLVSLPLVSEVPAERCETLDLTSLANTDPLTAPFGVPMPAGAHFLFTGLPLGQVTAAGVPFEIIDPAKNEGRAFVVLHSEVAPKNRDWPKSVEIPVGQQGKRLFFLGNVHGWGSVDSGTGPWGAVAQYVIHYTDGQEQIVPLVTGRTAEDWTLKPVATDVVVGLRGDPWHLNVLGVVLRSAPVDKITFLDLGTRAAPVLVAVTLEK